MEINLNEKYRIFGERLQYILQKRLKDRWINVSFYSNIESLLTDYIDMCARTSDTKSIKELLEYHKTLVAELNKALQPLQIRVELGEKDEKS